MILCEEGRYHDSGEHFEFSSMDDDNTCGSHNEHRHAKILRATETAQTRYPDLFVLEACSLPIFCVPVEIEVKK